MSEENIENITKSDSNFAPNFVALQLLPDITSRSEFLFTNEGMGKNVIFGADTSSSMHIYIKGKDILILGDE